MFQLLIKSVTVIDLHSLNIFCLPNAQTGNAQIKSKLVRSEFLVSTQPDKIK